MNYLPHNNQAFAYKKVNYKFCLNQFRQTVKQAGYPYFQ